MFLADIVWKTRLVVLTAIILHYAFNFVTAIHYERQAFSGEIQIFSSYDVIFTTSRPSEISCGWSCYKEDGCISFFYSKDSHSCIGSENPCQVSTIKEDDETNIYTCWTRTVGTSLPTDCLEVLSRNQSAEDGVYSITTGTGAKLDVYCVMSKRGGGWTVFLRRYSGEVPFNRTFQEYDEGFGDKGAEHWLGLRYIYEMTARVPSDIHISSIGGLLLGSEKEVYEEWSDFSIGPGPNYTLHVGSLITWTYDSQASGLGTFNESTGNRFSTWDVPLFSCGNNTCLGGHGGFWHRCCELNPTGIYIQPPKYSDNAMKNELFLGKISLKEMTLMYRRRVVEHGGFNNVDRK